MDEFADLSEQDTYGNTPLHLAALTKKTDVVRLFMQSCRPRLDLKNNEGLNPMEVSKNPEILAIFIQSIQKMK